MTIRIFIVIITFMLFNFKSTFAYDKVVLQLRWDHQFQFAGYYAAKWQGYYDEAGIDVDIKSAVTKKQILSAIKEVSEKRADFGIGATDILKARDEGVPLVIVASIFQNSAAAFYTREDTKINSPVDFLKVKVARRVDDLIDIELQAMLKAEGIEPDLVTPYPHQPGLDHLISGKVDVAPGYSINIPFTAETKGFPIREFKPIKYGIDFYGDSIFTHQDTIENNADMVKRFKSASIKGWEYALEHQEEIINQIISDLNRVRTIDDLRKFNEYQSNGVHLLTHHPVVEIGHMNPARWQRMHTYLKSIGLIKNPINIDEFIFNPEKLAQKQSAKRNKITIISLIVLLGGFCLVSVWIVFLRRAVRLKTSALSKANKLVKKNETYLKEILNSAENVAFVVTDFEGINTKILDLSPGTEKIFGYKKEELIGENVAILHPPEVVGKIPAMLKQIAETGAGYSDEAILIHKSGKKLHVLLSIFPRFGDGHKLIGTISVSIDISERKKEEEKFSRVYNQSPMLIGISTIEDGVYIDVNDSFTKITGYGKEETIGTTSIDLGLISVKDRNAIKQIFLKHGTIKDHEVQLKKKDETPFFGLLSCVPIVYEGQKRLLSTINDITERKQVEKELIKKRNQEIILNKRLQSLWQIAGMGGESLKTICDYALLEIESITNSQYSFLGFLNADNTEMTIYSWSPEAMSDCQITDKPLTFPISKAGIWAKSIREKRSIMVNDYQAPNQDKLGLPDGHVKITRTLSVPIIENDHIEAVAAVANKKSDYTSEDEKQVSAFVKNVMILINQKKADQEKENLEKQLRQLQKNEAIGALAGGIAHDFNNILFPIVGFAEMLKEDILEDSPFMESVDEILTGAKRAKELVKQILTFARQTEHELKPLRLQIITREVLKLIKSTIPATIEIKQDVDNDCAAVMADPTQIHQIAMNLITNAYHAMSEKGGILTVTLKNLENNHWPSEVELQKKDYVLFAVEDTGKGMNQQTLEKIFDPYFTTKSKDKGTGLGLSVVHGIVKNYGGEIEVESEPGAGTVFKIYLPASGEEISFDKDAQANYELGRNEKILLVDDETPILRLVEQMLVRLGYRVDPVNNSLEALNQFKNFQDEYDLIITDMTMPNMTGDILAQEVRKINPNIPIVICTGYSERITPERAISIGANGLILKPVVKSKLARIIREHL